MKTLITSTLRSGTTFAYELLKRLGYSSSHCDIYNFHKMGHWPEHDHYEVCAVAPRYREYWPGDMQIVHQRRHPLHVIESHTQGVKGKPRPWYMARWKLDELIKPDTTGWEPQDWVAWHYVTWSRLIERYAQAYYRVEHPDEIAYALGLPLDQQFLDVYDQAPRMSNKGNSNPRTLIPDVSVLHESLRGPVLQICEDYGYAPVYNGNG
jgi:hypothetical protein